MPEESRKTAHITFRLNGDEVDASFAPYKTLLEVLREDLAPTAMTASSI
jgi:aerobic-type carbon monoxide dehydrogenase small subunit (CoxS/CutS family)